MGDARIQRHSAHPAPLAVACITQSATTSNLRRVHERTAARLDRKRASGHGRISFHFAGLSSGDRSSRNISFGQVDGSALADLATLANANPVGERQPDVLQIDCEGCEWSTFSKLSHEPTPEALRRTRLLFFEAHMAPTMGPPTVRQFAAVFDFLFLTLGFRLAWLRMIDGYPRDQKVEDWLGVAGLNAGICCYEMALVRV